ncbi:MAG: HNH endonuclease [Pseudomonadota bacterium]
MLTQKRLREVLNYDPPTGIFTFAKGRRKGTVAGTKHDDRGFRKVAIDGERHLLHRLAWLWMTGVMPRWNIEHRDRDRTNNRWSNLREGVRGQKRQHRPTLVEPTHINGVWKAGERFDAMIEVDNIRLNLGSFETADNAANAVRITLQNALARQARNRGHVGAEFP